MSRARLTPPVSITRPTHFNAAIFEITNHSSLPYQLHDPPPLLYGNHFFTDTVAASKDPISRPTLKMLTSNHLRRKRSLSPAVIRRGVISQTERSDAAGSISKQYDVPSAGSKHGAKTTGSFRRNASLPRQGRVAFRKQ